MERDRRRDDHDRQRRTADARKLVYDKTKAVGVKGVAVERLLLKDSLVLTEVRDLQVHLTISPHLILELITEYLFQETCEIRFRLP